MYSQSSWVKFEDIRGAHHHGNQINIRNNKKSKNQDNPGSNPGGNRDNNSGNQNSNHSQKENGNHNRNQGQEGHQENNHGGNPEEKSITSNQFNNLSPNPKLNLYKRNTLPTSVKWKSANALKAFYISFTAHNGQQLHSQYILAPAFYTIYFQHGYDIYVVLGLANKMNIHACLKFISLEQFYNNNIFLFYALKQSLVSRGSDLIIQQESNTDGIVVYHNLIQKYQYSGDMETYKTKY